MKLSIIIVNYNVKYFLEQCLHSVYKAINNLEAEIFVVDNNSVDGSCAMVHEKFPNLYFIENKVNVGFSKANNQAIRVSKGEYVLLLNPDTVVEEDTFDKVVSFMDNHSDAGGLGVKMIDGKGSFLPESKRGLPTPMVSFYKIFGLSKLFPRSKRFAKYHLGFLDNDQTHEIEILAGAFMLMRKETLDKVGLLDEEFFMYGEDIDLSYRIILGGYKNYYYPDTTIIHYKGESTKKGSINYVKVFYNAMIIFARKHFSAKNAKLFSFFINLAIYFRALVAIFSQAFKSVFLPVLDAIVVFLGFWVIAPKWEALQFADKGHFPPEYYLFVVPMYILLWISVVWLSGGYEKPIKIFKISRGLIVGTGIILIIYALLPEHLRFSRAMILLGAVWALIGMNFIRLGLHIAGISSYKFDVGKKNRITLVGKPTEAYRVLEILNQSLPEFEYVGLISPKNDSVTDEYIGSLNQLKDIIRVNKVDEIIFCATDLTAQQIIQEMLRLEGQQVSYKIAPPESLSIIGSNSIDTAGDLYTVDFNNITKPLNIRIKRLFDLVFSILMIIIFPIALFVIAKPFGLLQNIFSVIFGLKSWVGFYFRSDINTFNLPSIKKGITSLVTAKDKEKETSEQIEKLNLLYAKDFRISSELSIILSTYKSLGSTCL